MTNNSSNGTWWSTRSNLRGVMFHSIIIKLCEKYICVSRRAKIFHLSKEHPYNACLQLLYKSHNAAAWFQEILSRSYNIWPHLLFRKSLIAVNSWIQVVQTADINDGLGCSKIMGTKQNMAYCEYILLQPKHFVALNSLYVSVLVLLILSL